MAIRLRVVECDNEWGFEWVALCAAESEEQPGDIYLGDCHHHALTEKFEQDFGSMGFLNYDPNTNSEKKPFCAEMDYCHKYEAGLNSACSNEVAVKRKSSQETNNRWRGETCKRCGRDQRMAWSVTDECWLRIVHVSWQERTLCLECFLKLADVKKEPIRLSDFRYLAAVAFGVEDGGPGLVDRPIFLDRTGD